MRHPGAEDGRHGEYQYQPNHWNCQAIWNRRHNDGGATHDEPVVGVTNYVYVKIRNRCTKVATDGNKWLDFIRVYPCSSVAQFVFAKLDSA